MGPRSVVATTTAVREDWKVGEDAKTWIAEGLKARGATMVMEDFWSGIGVDKHGDHPTDEWLRGLCPFCQGGVTQAPNDLNSFSIRVDSQSQNAGYHCHRGTCGVKGTVFAPGQYLTPEPPPRPPPAQPIYQEAQEAQIQQEPELLRWFKELGIPEGVYRASGVKRGQATLPEGEEEKDPVPCFAWPVKVGGRAAGNTYMLDLISPSAAPGLHGGGSKKSGQRYRWADVGVPRLLGGYKEVAQGVGEVFLVEDELDKMALEAALQHLGTQHAAQVVCLPPRAREHFEAYHNQHRSKHGKGVGGRGKGGDSPSLKEAVVFDYLRPQGSGSQHDDAALWGAPERSVGGGGKSGGLFPGGGGDGGRGFVRVVLVLAATTMHDAAFRDELAKRLGRGRCDWLEWPKHEEQLGMLQQEQQREEQQQEQQERQPPPDNKPVGSTWTGGAFDIVRRGKGGVEFLAWMLSKCRKNVALSGVITLDSLEAELLDMFNNGRSYNMGVSTGWESVDPLYTVVPGEVTIVTGE